MFTQRVEAEAVLLADVEALDVAGDVIPLEPVLRVPKVRHRAVFSGDRLAKVVWFTYALGLYM